MVYHNMICPNMISPGTASSSAVLTALSFLTWVATYPRSFRQTGLKISDY